jgi:hypothetical protein
LVCQAGEDETILNAENALLSNADDLMSMFRSHAIVKKSLIGRKCIGGSAEVSFPDLEKISNS